MVVFLDERRQGARQQEQADNKALYHGLFQLPGRRLEEFHPTRRKTQRLSSTIFRVALVLGLRLEQYHPDLSSLKSRIVRLWYLLQARHMPRRRITRRMQVPLDLNFLISDVIRP